jgi:hypothetical protein
MKTERIVTLAERNELLMDGTMRPVQQIISENDVTYAVWRDTSEEHGFATLIVKGESLLRQIVTSKTAMNLSISAIKCRDYDQAYALRCMAGSHDNPKRVFYGDR